MDDIHAQAKSGIKALMVRQVFLQIFTFGGGVILARVLGPAQFGLFAIVSFWVGILALVGDFGLAPSFIQRREELTERDLQVGFTIQQILTTIIVLALFLSAPWLSMLYPKAPHGMVWLVRALAFSLYLTSWRSMSALQLERRLQYKRLAWIEVVESVSYQGLAVLLVLMGFGVWSLIWAVLVRGVLGAVLVYLAAPWRIRLGFDPQIARDILRYGVPFQVQMITNQAATWLTPTFVAMLGGPQAVGFLMWASSNGKKPLILADNVMRVAFPHFSRIQHDRSAVQAALTRYLTYLLLPAGWWFAVLSTAGPDIVQVVYSSRWLPAVTALILFAASLYLDVIGFVVGITLNSLGLVAYTTHVVLIRTLVTIILGIVFVTRVGYNGIPLAYLIALLIAIPALCHGFGASGTRRVLGPVLWTLGPVLAGVSAGFLLAHAALTPGIRGALTTAVVSFAYVMGMWFMGPSWFKLALLRRYHRVVSPGSASATGTDPVGGMARAAK